MQAIAYGTETQKVWWDGLNDNATWATLSKRAADTTLKCNNDDLAICADFEGAYVGGDFARGLLLEVEPHERVVLLDVTTGWFVGSARLYKLHVVEIAVVGNAQVAVISFRYLECDDS